MADSEVAGPILDAVTYDGIVVSFDDMVKAAHKDKELRSVYESIICYSNASRKKRNVANPFDLHSIDYEDEKLLNAASSTDHKKRKICLHLLGFVNGNPCNKKLHGIMGMPKELTLGNLVPKKVDYCCGATSSSRPTQCLCRFIAFKTYSYTELLLVLEQIKVVRDSILNQYETDPVKTKELFNGVFGVCNVSSTSGSHGTRGLFYYFHAMKSLGSFCCNAMHVLLSPECWGVLSENVIRDNLRLKSLGKINDVKASFESKAFTNEWIIGRETHEAYSNMDILLGYAHYLLGDKNDRKDPSRTQLVKIIIENGLHQQPPAPTEISGRKEGASKGMKNFIEMYDKSLCISRAQVHEQYFKVANPKRHFNGLLFPCKGKTSDGIHHVFNGYAMELLDENLVIVEDFRMLFMKMFLPNGSVGLGNDNHKLSNVAGCESLLSWNTGDFVGHQLKPMFPGISARQLPKAVWRFLNDRCLKDASKARQIYVSISFKMNALVDGDIRLQQAHMVLPPALLERDDVVFVRCIIPLDNAGLALRVWDKGYTQGSDTLLYIPPGVMCILPVSIPTSDCIRFSPGGQRRIEMLLCFTTDSIEDITPSISFHDEYHYMETFGTVARDYSVMFEEDATYSNNILRKFVNLFSSGSLL